MSLQIGQSIPEVTLFDQHENAVMLHKIAEGKSLVVYFYPKDHTPGCTAEACSFRDHYEDFEAVGAQVIGISGDSTKSHQRFANKHRLNFLLLSDPKRVAEKAFGVPRNLFGLLPGRVTYVFDTSGKLIYHFSSATSATRHIQEALNALKPLPR